MSAQTASTPQLFSAIGSGDLAQVNQLLDADPTLSATPNAEGVSPLLWSLYTGHRDIADRRANRPDQIRPLHG